MNGGGSTLVETLRVDARHPSLPGHFPGHPVVPGVVLLDRVAAALERAGGGTLRHIAMVKFTSSLLPGQSAVLTLAIEGQRVRFRVERDGTTILHGQARRA